ncbi:FtsB family cell division protein [Aneurinibacillus aneurinilyticus]|uniref:Septum formation initiator family protein n=2 Tax=Aneurinibacillus aneurinilyticus TaxID=1391 RepID=A0A848CWH5_ANEAE|nr:septum formation initiator family protein [Aneurinibacillus aneurinilyticus]MCI1695323.1 septum formation initiator family protein [Aneurinibacillus aneurinilyticus]MED0671581.1 septum formation initiator family protein [Aneurinibacillus aneurinilyticus]MED0706873.1 septum formation initiator family protein [Aneurinibacillus aneurinilyticus]MED0723376.1 septum formation initiator family protein [Aneurinibacillus aneurinilyticus]MED0733489.1 septum formation initiator family protein [Aneurin
MQQQPQSRPSSYGRKRRMRLLQIIVVLFLSWAGYTYYSQSEQLASKQSELVNLQREVTKVEEDKKQLELQVKRMNDQEYISELARKNFFLSKEGEIIFLTPDENKKKQ